MELPEDWSETFITPPSFAYSYTPEHPVVVQQYGSGVTVCVTVTTHPLVTVHHYYTCQHPPEELCRYWGIPDCDQYCIPGTIREHTTTSYTSDPPLITTTMGTLLLSAESQTWIESVLGPRFGAVIHHPAYVFGESAGGPPFPWNVQGPNELYEYIAAGCLNFPLEDPGWWLLDVGVTTAHGISGHFPEPGRIPCTAFGVTIIH
ncbi:MAG: hypothetical protein QW260_05655 [Thermoproteota archaeon]